MYNWTWSNHWMQFYFQTVRNSHLYTSFVVTNCGNYFICIISVLLNVKSCVGTTVTEWRRIFMSSKFNALTLNSSYINIISIILQMLNIKRLTNWYLTHFIQVFSSGVFGNKRKAYSNCSTFINVYRRTYVHGLPPKYEW